MSLHAQLQRRAAEGQPIRIGLIGAGKFGAMYLSQVPRTPGIHLIGIADLSPANARANLERKTPEIFDIASWTKPRLDFIEYMQQRKPT